MEKFSNKTSPNIEVDIVIPKEKLERLSPENRRSVRRRLDDIKILNFCIEKLFFDLTHQDVIMLKFKREIEQKIDAFRNEIQGNQDYLLDILKIDIGGDE